MNKKKTIQKKSVKKSSTNKSVKKSSTNKSVKKSTKKSVKKPPPKKPVKKSVKKSSKKSVKKSVKKSSTKKTNLDKYIDKVVFIKLPNNNRKRYRWITKKNNKGRFYARAPKINVLLKDLDKKRNKDYNKEAILPENIVMY
tara:strand:+ start:3446 stop:3868 length:423 start_codon:yes stop_codon:yes gene_type:complete